MSQKLTFDALLKETERVFMGSESYESDGKTFVMSVERAARDVVNRYIERQSVLWVLENMLDDTRLTQINAGDMSSPTTPLGTLKELIVECLLTVLWQGELRRIKDARFREYREQS